MVIKKLLCLVAFITSTTSCFSQLNWKVEAGLNYSNITAKDRDGNKANTSSVPGISIGLGADIFLSDQFSLQPSLVYARRGFKQNGSSSHIGWGKDFEAKGSYLELPVDLQYNPKLWQGRLLLAAGPYLGYGTSGKWKTDGSAAIGDILIGDHGDIDFQNDNSSVNNMNTYVYAKPWDYGLHVKIGYSLFEHYSFSFDIQRGLADLQPRWADYRPESTIRNKSFGLSLGYTF